MAECDTCTCTAWLVWVGRNITRTKSFHVRGQRIHPVAWWATRGFEKASWRNGLHWSATERPQTLNNKIVLTEGATTSEQSAPSAIVPWRKLLERTDEKRKVDEIERKQVRTLHLLLHTTSTDSVPKTLIGPKNKKKVRTEPKVCRSDLFLFCPVPVPSLCTPPPLTTTFKFQKLVPKDGMQHKCAFGCKRGRRASWLWLWLWLGTKRRKTGAYSSFARPKSGKF